MPGHPRLGVVMHRSFAPADVVALARHAETTGLDDVWVIEDCFYTTGTSLAAAVLTATDRIRVGIGILPAVMRTAALTAMEIATLAGLGPGRLTAGIGHGVQGWMDQMGVRPESPVGTLRVTVEAVRALLHGQTVTVDRHGVTLRDVSLAQPPAEPPPVLAGVRGPVSLAAMGEVADGVLLAEPAAPDYVRWAVEQAGASDGFTTMTYAPWCVMEDAAQARRTMAPWLADMLDHGIHDGFRSLSFGDELVARWRDGGADALADMPAAWWTALGPVGTFEHAAAYLQAVAAAGATTVACYPAPDVERAHRDIDQMARVRAHST